MSRTQIRKVVTGEKTEEPPEKLHKIGDLQVWWCPQVPMDAFEVDVESVMEAVKLMRVLADYDKFQYDNKIKPDYSNAGGLNRWCADDGDGNPGWESWYDEETGEDDPEVWLKEMNKITCSLCKNKVAVETAHWHQGKWIGDECCWDERLRSSE